MSAPLPVASLDSASPPRVSVVVPSYNYGHFIAETIASVLAQAVVDWELIVIDDGSTDDTRKVVESFCTDGRIRYVFQVNAGLSASRNAGLALARGEFIAFLDADDLWEPHHLELCLARLTDLGPAYGLIAGETERIGPDGARMTENRNVARYCREGEIAVREFCLCNRPFPSAVLARRAVYDQCGGFDTILRSSEDRDMWIRATGKARFWILGTVTVFIRRHPHNMSKNAPRMKQNTRETLLRAFRRGSVPRRNLVFWTGVFAVHYFQVSWTHFDEGRRAAAFRYLAVSWLLRPVFLRPATFYEPPLFRLRALVHFALRTLASWRRRGHTHFLAWI